MSRFGGLSEERPSVFKTRSKLGTHLSTQSLAGMKGRVDLAQPVHRTPDLCYTRAFGDGPHGNFEPWSSDVDDT
ncbi:hypothetical protein TNCV_3189121 [Trichonephila clavipes]|nr:hypothetical protein TNCV_3189121 [Trichonephila clavipes]